MEKEVLLRPGTPDDDNREYLPEKIKGSDIVVNENGNNSQPYPAGLREVTGVLADGLEDRWYEYVPASYDGSKPVPLVVGTATKGIHLPRVRFSQPQISRMSSTSWESTIRTPLAVSMTEPPPTATRLSQPF